MAHLSLLRQFVAITAAHIPRQLHQVRTIKRWVAPTLRELEKRRRKAGPQLPSPRSQYLEWNYDAEIYAFAKRLHEEFNDGLLRRAFTHRSYVVKHELQAESAGTDAPALDDNRELINEGAELISDCVRSRFEKVYIQEIVDSIHSFLTSEGMLAHVAFHMGVKDLILSSEYPPEKPTLANTFKALIGALNRSGEDKKRVETFINDFLICQLNGKELYDIWSVGNPYDYLLRLAKAKGIREIEPRLCNQSATNTILANYQVGLYNDKKLLGIGWGESVEIAKDAAALNAIQRIENLKEL